MEPRNKKSRKNQGEKHDLDRLSSLPDSILTHIFSFLDSDSVIRTSVLSKRYKLLWTLSPCLHFRLSELDNDKFESYVNHVLHLREHSNLVNFRLSLHKAVGLEFVHSCVCYAAEHKVQHLRLRGYFHRKPLALPDHLLNLPSLISLNLHNATSNSIELPNSVSLPNLKFLCLKNFEFSDKNYNKEVFSGCPSLEALVLHKCSIMPVNKVKTLNLNCLNLKHLEIKRWRSPWRCFDEHMINVDAPKLVSLNFQGNLVKVSFKEVLPCLERACFDLFFPTACHMIDASERKKKTSQCFFNMLLNACNVKVISLSFKTIEIVCSLHDLRAHAAPIMFENLRIIKFTAEKKYGEKTIPIETVNQMLEKIATDILIFDDYKVKKVLTESSKANLKDGRHISIPAKFMQFLLDISPAAEVLTLDMPNLSSEEAEEIA